MTTNNQQVEEMRENIQSSLYQIRNRALRDAPVYLQHVNMAELTLLRHFTAQLTLKDEQHARELKEVERRAYKQGWDSAGGECIGDLKTIELARIEAKTDFINSIITRLPSDEFGKQKYVLNLGAYELLDKLSELNTQKEKLLNEQ